MVRHFMLFHIACLFALGFAWPGTFKNFTDVARQYIEFCGGHILCNENNFDETIEDGYEQEDSSICPSCSCTKSCHVTGNCCPDINLSTCIPTQRYITSLATLGWIYHKVVSFCPLEDGQKEPVLCILPTDETNVLTQVPVTSTRTKISYASKRCAECHNDTEVIAWSLNIKCSKEKIDLSVISDLLELVALMKEKECSEINFDPPSDYAVQRCWKEFVIQKCNVTGLWDKPDADLETACTDIWSPYGSFQNVFCFLCNTDSQHRQQFLRQQQTNNSISSSDVNREQCALSVNKTCPLLVFRENWQILYIDARVALTEKYVVYNDTYVADIEFSSSTLPKKLQAILLANSFSNITHNMPSLNLTSLFHEYVKSGGFQDWCLDDHKIGNAYPGLRGRKTCSCDQDCYLTSTCCPDAAYYHKISCIRPFLGKLPPKYSLQSIFLNSKCSLEYSNTFVKDMCEKTDYFDILHIPVIDVRNNKVFKNSYCFLCSDDINMINESIPFIKPWNVSIFCPQIFFPMILPSMESLLRYAEQIGCFLHFKTNFHVENCDVDFTINKCNSTGLSISVSENALHLCEDPDMTFMTKSKNKMYRNIICDLCNSVVLEDPISRCNVTGTVTYTKNILLNKYNCENQPLDDNEYPFKNVFCKTCNYDNSEYREFGEGTDTYRQLFSILEMHHKKSSISADSCNVGEIYDIYRKACRKLHCSPGKRLLHGACTPLINEIESLRYSLAVKILISPESDMSIPIIHPNDFFNEFDFYLETLFPEVSITINQSHLLQKRPCDLFFGSSNPIEVLVYAQVEITQPMQGIPLNRRELENKMLNFTEWRVNLHGISLRFEENVQAWYLPNRKRFSLSPNECIFHKYQSEKESSVGNVYFFDVNKLLKCPQIQLDDNEFTFLDNQLEIHVPLIDRKFLINEFVRNKNSKVQICAESYTSNRSVLKQIILMETVLPFVTLIVTIVSLICSFITFLSFSMLPALRTVPGKNIMCFTFSLFFAQLIFLSRSYIKNKLSCHLIGGLAHYFWISVFVCSNVCCFHMFKVFVVSSHVQSNTLRERKLVLRYCFLSYVLPTLPVVFNIALHYLKVKIGGYEFGYGGEKCFLLSSLALLLTFILPILLQIFINIVMFSVTFHYIRNTPKVQSSKDRNDFSIFFKLFLLTGISWCIMVVDGFFEVSLFTVFSTFLNGTQGLFLFLSYICNRKVWILLKKRFGKGVQTQGASTSGLTLVKSNQNNPNRSVYSETIEASG